MEAVVQPSDKFYPEAIVAKGSEVYGLSRHVSNYLVIQH